MRTVTRVFGEVAVFGEKSGKCEVCGKSCKRREKFSQTQNPYNRGKDGLPKSRSEIVDELMVLSAEWKLKPVRHSKCESAA